MQTIDIGINLINKQFQFDANDVIQRAIDKGVTQMILTGTNLAVSEKSVGTNILFILFFFEY